MVAPAGTVRERPGSVAWQLSSLAAGSRCGIKQRLRRASTITLAWSKSASEARQGARCSQRDADSSCATPAASQLVQLAGMSERLPSGSTTSNSRTPRRFMAPITCNERPSNGCRSRRIITKLDMSRRWVVCDGFLRCHGPLMDQSFPRAPYRGQAHPAPHCKMAQGWHCRRWTQNTWHMWLVPTATVRPPSPPALKSHSLSALRRLADEVCGFVRAARPLVRGNLRVRAQRTRAIGSHRDNRLLPKAVGICGAATIPYVRRHNPVGRGAVFDPLLDGRDLVKMISGPFAALAVHHSRHHKKS